MRLKIEREALKKETDARHPSDRLVKLEKELDGSRRANSQEMTQRWEDGEGQGQLESQKLKEQLDQGAQLMSSKAQRGGDLDQGVASLLYGHHPARLRSQLDAAETGDRPMRDAGQ